MPTESDLIPSRPALDQVETEANDWLRETRAAGAVDPVAERHVENLLTVVGMFRSAFGV